VKRPRLITLSAASVFILVASGILVVDLQARPIRAVRIAGEFQHLARPALQESISGALSARFFSVDVNAVRDAARRLPWVRDVSVRRVWPDSLHVAVVERVAVARWGEHGLLEEDGALFIPERKTPQSDLVQLRGPDGSQWEVLSRYRALRTLLAPAGQSIVTLELSNRGAWTVALENGVRLKLGQSPSEETLQGFARAMTAVIRHGGSAIDSVDLRYINGFAVRWKEKPPAQG